MSFPSLLSFSCSLDTARLGWIIMDCGGCLRLGIHVQDYKSQRTALSLSVFNIIPLCHTAILVGNKFLCFIPPTQSPIAQDSLLSDMISARLGLQGCSSASARESPIEGEGQRYSALHPHPTLHSLKLWLRPYVIEDNSGKSGKGIRHKTQTIICVLSYTTYII